MVISIEESEVITPLAKNHIILTDHQMEGDSIHTFVRAPKEGEHGVLQYRQQL
jgi:hypothetical protein